MTMTLANRYAKPAGASKVCILSACSITGQVWLFKRCFTVHSLISLLRSDNGGITQIEDETQKQFAML